MSSILSGLGGYGMPGPAEDPEETRRRALMEALGQGSSPAFLGGAGPVGGVEPPPPPVSPIREAMPVMPASLPIRPETGTGANIGDPMSMVRSQPASLKIGTGINPTYGTKDASGMSMDSPGQAPTPRLSEMLTPVEEADRYMAHEDPAKKRGVMGTIGDVLKGILFGLSSGQGAIAGGLYGGTGQGREDARKLRREEKIGEITRNRGMQDQMRMQQLETLAKQGDIAASEELANLRRAQAHAALAEKPAKYGFGGFDQPMITATDPTTGAIRQYKNEGYTAKPAPTQQPEWVDQPDGSKIAYKRDEAGNPVVWTLQDGTPWRKMPGPDKETSGDRTQDIEAASAAWLGSPEGQGAWGAAVEFAQNQRLRTFGVTRADYHTELKRLEDEIAAPLPEDRDSSEYADAVAAKKSAQVRAAAIRKAVAEGEEQGTKAWKEEAKRRATAGGGGGARQGGVFGGVSGWSGGQ